MRNSGILMHISSLPSDYGIGTLGKEAYKFVDFLKEAGQRYWQILPICPTSFGDSPYQSCSLYAGNPYFIDLDILAKEGLLKKSEYKNIKWNIKDDEVDYGLLYDERFKVLYKAYKRFNIEDEKYQEFILNNAYWLDDYSLYMAIKKIQDNKAWYEWEDKYKNRDIESIDLFKKENEEEINFNKVIQYLFFKEWHELKDYANKQGIYIIGDMPIYCALDSVDVWSNNELFLLDENKEALYVAGVPGDSFSDAGQLWGNPLYNWQDMANDNYAWFTKRMAYLANIFDVLRIDHFRGLEEYFAIPNGKKPSDGKWYKGPGLALFKALEERYGKLNIIAEDLGFITDEVRKLLDDCGFMGMKVLEFAFSYNDHNSSYLPHNISNNYVAYLGTHDNDPVMAWFKSLNKDDKRYVIDYLRLNKEEGYKWGLLKSLWATSADLAIAQAQDILGLDEKSRMNTPATLGTNWKWRANKNDFNKKLAKEIAYFMKVYNR